MVFFNGNVFGHYEGGGSGTISGSIWALPRWALSGLYQGSTRPSKVSALQVPSKTRANVQNREIPDVLV